ncbi:alpha/beta fold hydrolase [Robertkochia solimangrovi]|uniref:alpha/beta fold hydrolase n=1 Tax=Robertkochia solimangrovi TaxID=2213046 RepID=UPI0013A5454A|nr:alpha/beta hydrolase [Robertkochia solimangrovi]
MKSLVSMLMILMSSTMFAQYDTEKTFPLKGSEVPVRYSEIGKGDLTLVLLHGLGSSSEAFRKIIDGLPANYNVITLDLPGYGKNEQVNFTPGMSAYATLIRDMMRETGKSNVVLFGHSMGGQIAMKLAVDNPEESWLKGLFLIAPAGIEIFNDKEKEWFATYTTPEMMSRVGDEQIKKNFDINFASGKLPEDAVFMYEDRIAIKKDSVRYHRYLQTVSSNIQSMLDEPVMNEISSLHVPALIVFGEQDYLIPNQLLHPDASLDDLKVALKGANENIGFETIDSGGHFLIWDQPVKVVSRLQTFCESLQK